MIKTIYYFTRGEFAICLSNDQVELIELRRVRLRSIIRRDKYIYEHAGRYSPKEGGLCWDDAVLTPFKDYESVTKEIICILKLKELIQNIDVKCYI